VSKVSILGAFNTPFGRFVKKNRETKEITDLKSYYDLLVDAGRGALDDAALPAAEVDGVWVGTCSPSLFVNQEHAAPLAAEIDPALRLKPMTRCEGACASSSVALFNAIYGIESGRFKTALVVGVEKMNTLGTKGVTHALATCSHWPTEGAQGWTFPMLFAAYANGYREHYGIDSETLRRMFATVSALSYRNGARNPLAHFGADGPAARMGLFDADAIMALPDEGRGGNPMIADPLRLHDCSLISDGAAALVLGTTEHARQLGGPVVEIAGIGHSVERLPENVRPNMYELIAGKHAVRLAYDEAGITATDLDLAEVHDCFSVNQVLCTEALGLSKDGQAGHDYLAGRYTPEDRCPVNLSGGLKAKGHPVGATGASMHALVYKQLVGKPIGVAAKDPEVGAVFNVGGSAVSNCVTVLRRTS